MLLYDTSWLGDVGNSIHPSKDYDQYRYLEYELDRNIFNGVADKTSAEAFRALGGMLYLGFSEVFNLTFFLNYQRLSSIKLADMVCGAYPTITYNNDPTISDNLLKLREITGFNTKLHEMVIDYSRYGLTIPRAWRSDDNKPKLSILLPDNFYIIHSNDGANEPIKYVYTFVMTEQSTKYLYALIFPAVGGAYEKHKYLLDDAGEKFALDKTAGKSEVKFETINPNVQVCTVSPIANVPTSENPYGVSDYRVLNGLIVKATERMKQILGILDRHADPSMAGPVGLLKEDKDGNLVFEPKRYYGVSDGQELPAYITWDGKLDAAFKALDELLNQIYVLSEMGEAFLGNTKGTSNAISGTAMRYKLIAPIMKARRVANSFTLPVKSILAALYEIEYGKVIDPQSINVTWEDSLPKDPREIAELARLITGKQQILPLKKILMEYYGYDDKDATELLNEIEKDLKRFGADTSGDVNPAKKEKVEDGKTGSESRK